MAETPFDPVSNACLEPILVHFFGSSSRRAAADCPFLATIVGQRTNSVAAVGLLSTIS
jgi:hypothetical protein